MIAERRTGRLLSVNVGLPQDVAWRGRTVHTGSLEGAGRRAAAWCGGSTSTATGRATSAGTAASTARSSSTSSTPTGTGRSSWAATTSPTASSARTSPSTGLADDEVCIGDRYRIGEALFEVTQPRVTCYRVGIRMDEPRIPALLVPTTGPASTSGSSRRARSEAGDEIVKVAAGPER